MKTTFLKSLFKKRKFDWDSDDYKKKSLALLVDATKLEFYQEETQNKEEFLERFKKLLED
jgi:hypothetical protein